LVIKTGTTKKTRWKKAEIKGENIAKKPEK
jgi:hypothetical protein